ncbi:MAG: hypothetical protein AB7O24_01070 [Kofleriaceae bacterium]
MTLLVSAAVVVERLTHDCAQGALECVPEIAFVEPVIQNLVEVQADELVPPPAIPVSDAPADHAIDVPGTCSLRSIQSRSARRASARSWFLALASGEQRIVRKACRELAVDPCAGVLGRSRPMIAPDYTDEAAGSFERSKRVTRLVEKLAVEQRGCVEDYCAAMNPAQTCETPLVMSFDARPVEFAAATGDAFAFTPGDPAVTDWPAANTPWIALDRDGDGAISSGAELFGSATVLADGSIARDGFGAIAPLDVNRDNVLDARDPMFASLLLWFDRDGDRTSTPDELTPLAARVTAISLAHRLEVRCTDRGACEGERSEVSWRDSAGALRTGAVVDVYLPRR